MGLGEVVSWCEDRFDSGGELVWLEVIVVS